MKVSRKTDVIFELESTGYPNIYEAVAMASVICEGEVEMPTIASEGRFYLKSTPGGKHAGKSFEFYIRAQDSSFTLTASCFTYRVMTPPPR